MPCRVDRNDRELRELGTSSTGKRSARLKWPSWPPTIGGIGIHAFGQLESNSGSRRSITSWYLAGCALDFVPMPPVRPDRGPGIWYLPIGSRPVRRTHASTGSSYRR